MHAPKFLAPVTALDACPRGPEGRGGGGGVPHVPWEYHGCCAHPSDRRNKATALS